MSRQRVDFEVLGFVWEKACPAILLRADGRTRLDLLEDPDPGALDNRDVIFGTALHRGDPAAAALAPIAPVMYPERVLCVPVGFEFVPLESEAVLSLQQFALSWRDVLLQRSFLKTPRSSEEPARAYQALVWLVFDMVKRHGRGLTDRLLMASLAVAISSRMEEQQHIFGVRTRNVNATEPDLDAVVSAVQISLRFYTQDDDLESFLRGVSAYGVCNAASTMWGTLRGSLEMRRTTLGEWLLLMLREDMDRGVVERATQMAAMALSDAVLCGMAPAHSISLVCIEVACGDVLDVAQALTACGLSVRRAVERCDNPRQSLKARLQSVVAVYRQARTPFV